MTRNDESFEVSEKNFDVIVSHDVYVYIFLIVYVSLTVSVRTPEIRKSTAQGRRGFARRRRPRPGELG